MPVLAGRTRVQLRQAVGDNIGNFFVGSTTSAGGDTTSVIDTKLRGGDDSKIAKWVRFTSGTLDGETSRADDYVQSTGDITVAPAFTLIVPNGATYELWPEEIDPIKVDRFLIEAILDTYGRAYKPVESLALHTGGGTTNTVSSSASQISRTGGAARFDIPTTLTAIRQIQSRVSVTSQEIHSAESAWDESVASGLTAAVDTEIRWRGNSSLRVTVAASAASNALITDNLASIDISGKTHIEFWTRSSITTAAGAIDLLLDDTANCASPIETLAFPALTADTDTFVRIPLAAMELDTAIISVGVRFTTDNGAQVFWIDDIQAIDEDSSNWIMVSQRGWWIDQGTSDLYFTEAARIDLGYSLLKLVGGDSPLLLTSDSSVNEVDDLFVILLATSLTLDSVSGIKEEYARRAITYGQRATRRKKALNKMRGARSVA